MSAYGWPLIACADVCGLRLVESAYDEAAELYHDERDALRAHQAQTKAKAV